MLRYALPGLLRNSLVAVAIVPLLAVGKKPVDDDATDREDEDEDRPEELVADRAGRLQDLDCRFVSTLRLAVEIQECDLLQTRMSSTRTMKPTIPPPAPYCVVESMVLRVSSAIGAA
jgi:hypothetical protein